MNCDNRGSDEIFLSFSIVAISYKLCSVHKQLFRAVAFLMVFTLTVNVLLSECSVIKYQEFGFN